MIFAIVVVVVLGRFALRHGWPGTRRARGWLQSHRGQLETFVRRSPATFLYLAILTVTTWVLIGSSSGIANALLADQSTNLHHLTHDPVHVLIRSAFWLDDYRELMLWIVLFVVVLAPAERWLGTGRWFVTFVLGHVGATVLTAAGIWITIRTGATSQRLENVVDVGVSYGFCAVAALFTFRLRRPWRGIWAGGLLMYAVIGIGLDASFTSVGHATALAIGFALYPFSRAPAVKARTDEPLLLPETPT
jgi:hypothetical protein